MLEYLIKEAIDFYMKENKTSKRQAIYAVNEVIKKLSHEVQEEEQKTGKCTISSLYGECVTANPVDNESEQAHNDLINLIKELELDWEGVIYFASMGTMRMLELANDDHNITMILHLLVISKEFNQLANKIHESGVKKNV